MVADARLIRSGIAHLLRFTLVVALGVGATTGCSRDSASPIQTWPGAEEFTQYGEQVLEQADELGLSPEQREVIESSLVTGEIAFADYETAIDATLACLDDAGVRNERQATDVTQGYPIVRYAYESPPEGNLVAEACARQHSEFVETLYVIQPSSIEQANLIFERAMPTLIPCLEEAGYPLPENPSIGEVRSALLEMHTDPANRERVAADPYYNPYRCADEAGLNGF